MRLRSIKLRGMIGIYDGLGLDELEIDLAGLTGVVALVGSNGCGKSTTIESLQPYTFLPSRKIDLNDAARLKDSYRDFQFEWAGQVYRSLVMIDGPKRKLDGYLWEMVPPYGPREGFRDTPDRPLTSGKISEYKEQIEKLFGSEDLFFNSVFAASGVESLLSQKASKRKDFFVELLGHQRYQGWSESAKQCATLIAGVIEGWRSKAQKLETDSSQLDIWRERLESMRSLCTINDENIQAAAIRIETLKTEIQSLENRRGDVASIRLALGKLRGDRETLILDYDRRRNKIDGERHDITQFLNAAQKDLDGLLNRIGEFSNTPDISLEMIQTLETELQAVEATIAADTETHTRTLRLQTEYDTQLAVCRTRYKAAAELAGVVAKIPDTADPNICGQCGLAKAGLEAKNAMELLTKEAAELNQKYDPMIADLRKQLKSDGTAGLRKDELKSKILNARAIHQKRSSLEILQATVSNKTEQIARERAKAADLQHESGTVTTDYGRRRECMDRDIAAEEQRLSFINVDSEISAKQTALNAEVQSRNGLQKRLDQDRVAMGILEKDIERGETAAAELVVLRTQLDAADRDRSDWALLQQVCGRDRLQALELDAAAPGITRIGNLLLAECFGGRYQMKFETMDPAGREIFDLIIEDMKLGKSDSLQLKSGGQKVLALQALRLAIVLYGKEQSGRQHHTLLCDEIEAALAPETKEQFVTMFRSAMRIGNFETCFIVTHSPEIAACADHVMEFGKGSVSIR